MQIVHLRIPRGGGSLRSTWSDLLFVPYNVTITRLMLSVARIQWVWPGLWIYGKWQRLESVH